MPGAAEKRVKLMHSCNARCHTDRHLPMMIALQCCAVRWLLSDHGHVIDSSCFNKVADGVTHVARRHILRRAEFDAAHAQVESRDFQGVKQLLARLQNPF